MICLTEAREEYQLLPRHPVDERSPSKTANPRTEPAVSRFATYSLMTFELLRPHSDDLEGQLYRTVSKETSAAVLLP